jgi:hypothetical protein
MEAFTQLSHFLNADAVLSWPTGRRGYHSIACAECYTATPELEAPEGIFYSGRRSYLRKVMHARFYI